MTRKVRVFMSPGSSIDNSNHECIVEVDLAKIENVQLRPANQQIPFLGQGDMSLTHKLPFSGHIVKKFQRVSI